MKLSIILFSLLISLSSWSENTEQISLAKAAELSSHRVDRLVTLSKIDPQFLNRLEKIEVTYIENSLPAVFRSVVSQTQPDQGAPLQIEILLATDGKPVSFKVLDGGNPGPDPGWNTKDPVSLSENALHYVLENFNDAKIAPYYFHFKSYTLSRGSLNGNTVAVGTVTSSVQSEKLVVYLNLDGTFISAEIVQDRY